MLFRKRIKFNSGVVEDPREVVDQERDFKASEIMVFGVPNWVEKPESEWRKFPIFNQDGSYSCLANATAKALGIENWLEDGKFVRYSARDIYTHRSNYPAQGMWFQDALQIGYKHGATLEQLMISDGLNEEAMNNYSDRKSIDQQIALVGKAGSYLWLPVDIDAIANIIEPVGRAVVLGVKFAISEWNRPVPMVLDQEAPYNHGICATNAILYQGKKAIVIEDSWGISTGINGRRIVTEDWFKAGRVSAALYFLPLENIWRDKPKPRWHFKQVLLYGMENRDVEMLQEILKFEGFFSTNGVSTGYYGNITARGVLQFQMKYQISKAEELIVLEGRQVGQKTMAKLNELYGDY